MQSGTEINDVKNVMAPVTTKNRRGDKWVYCFCTQRNSLAT